MSCSSSIKISFHFSSSGVRSLHLTVVEGLVRNEFGMKPEVWGWGEGGGEELEVEEAGEGGGIRWRSSCFQAMTRSSKSFMDISW